MIQARRIRHVLLPLLLVAIPALADNPDLLATLPTFGYTDADRAQLETTLIIALNMDRDGKSRHWKNPATGHRGRIKIVRTLPGGNPPCREMRVTGYFDPPVGKISNVVTYCRLADGNWSVPAPENPTSAPDPGTANQ